MLELAAAMGWVAASWLAFFLIFCGLGLLALRALGQKQLTGWLLIDSFWLGWALAIGALQFWHFFFPVNDAILILFALVASVMLLSRRRALGGALKHLRQQRGFLLFFSLLLLWFANRALGMPLAFDTGFRDLQAVMWIDSYAIVPGLGNLFASLAYNHSVYLYNALLDTAIWSGISYRIATGLLLLVYLAYAIRCALALYRCREPERIRWSWIAALLTIPFVLHYTTSWSGITHYLTDTVVDILGFLTLIYMLDILQDWNDKSGYSHYQVMRLAILILLGMTVKQSYVVYGMGTAALLAILWARRGGAAFGLRAAMRIALPIAAIGAALLLPWAARGLMTSGYIAYPQSIGRLEVDWAMPRAHMQDRQQDLATNTRQRGADPALVLASSDWLGPWLLNFVSNLFATVLPSVITIAALALYGAGRARQRQRYTPELGLWLLAPMLLMLAVWFVSLPEIKYVRYLFWNLAAVSAVLAFLAWQSQPLQIRLGIVYALMLICAAYVFFLVLGQGTGPLPAGPDRGFHLHWQTEYSQFTTDSGLVVNIPTHGSKQCWHTPLPCTPHPSAALQERVPGELRYGFTVGAGAGGQGQ